MNIKFTPKICKNFLSTAAVGSCGILGLKNADKQEDDTQIKELSDLEFKNMLSEIEKKKSKLSKNNRHILECININKNNIQCLNKLMDNNSDFYCLYSTLHIDNINSAKLLYYELSNIKEIKEKLGIDFIFSGVHKTVKTPEDGILKQKLIDFGLKNPQKGRSVFFADIVETATSMDEALKMMEHCEKYGCLPLTRTYLGETFGKEYTKKMLDGVYEAKQRFNLNTDRINSSSTGYDEQKYNILSGSNNTYFRFDAKTGEIVSCNDENTIYNLSNHTVTEVTPHKIQKDKKLVFDDEMLMSATINHKSLNGDLIKREKYNKSKLRGEFEVKETTPNGIKYTTSLAETGRRGNKHIEKHFVSPDGTATDYVFAVDRKGNRFLYYKITDKNKKVLYESSKSFKVITDNHFQSTTDGIKYDILIENDKIKVTKLDGSDKSVEYNIKEFTKQDYENMSNFEAEIYQNDELLNKLKNNEVSMGEIAVQKGYISEYTVDKKLLKTIKNLSGEEWFALKNSKVYTVNAYPGDKNTAHSMKNGIEIGTENNFLSILEHEIGHEKYNTLNFENDAELKEIYEYEKSAFTTSLPDIAVKQAGYFLRNTMSNGLNETAAEANMLINIPQQTFIMGSRALFLQKYFPRTIAYIANKYKELGQ